MVFVCTLQFCLLGGRGSRDVGYQIETFRAQWIYPFIATLPADSIVAGWPGPTEAIDNVPYVSARTAFLTFENHETYHRGYADLMRKRMRVLIDAYYATEVGPLIRLRDEFGVTHLIVNPNHMKDEPAVYMRPFGAWAGEAFARGRKKGFEVLRQLEPAGVYDDGNHWVLDLSALRSGDERAG